VLQCQVESQQHTRLRQFDVEEGLLEGRDKKVEFKQCVGLCFSSSDLIFSGARA
jgi:hypothetical protein